jgi:hypothetical protein
MRILIRAPVSHFRALLSLRALRQFFAIFAVRAFDAKNAKIFAKHAKIKAHSKAELHFAQTRENEIPHFRF